MSCRTRSSISNTNAYLQFRGSLVYKLLYVCVVYLLPGMSLQSLLGCLHQVCSHLQQSLTEGLKGGREGMAA